MAKRYMSDAVRLLAGIAVCDGEAFGVFYRRHLPRTVGYLLRETRDREVAADLAAEVFSAVLLSAERYRPDRETAMPWVLCALAGISGRRARAQAVSFRARFIRGCSVGAVDANIESSTRIASPGGQVTTCAIHVRSVISLLDL